MTLQQCRHILEICLARDPSQMFDILHLTASDAPPACPPLSAQPSWCVCTNCREMPSNLERKYCGQQQQHCISRLPHMEAYILQEGVLCLARCIWTDIRAVPDAVESNRQFHYAAYRQFVVWQYGALGQGHRVVIPSCCVWTIHDRFPDPHGQYQGYVPQRL